MNFVSIIQKNIILDLKSSVVTGMTLVECSIVKSYILEFGRLYLSAKLDWISAGITVSFYDRIPVHIEIRYLCCNFATIHTEFLISWIICEVLYIP